MWVFRSYQPPTQSRRRSGPEVTEKITQRPNERLRTGRFEWRTAPQWHRRQAARTAGAFCSFCSSTRGTLSANDVVKKFFDSWLNRNVRWTIEPKCNSASQWIGTASHGLLVKEDEEPIDRKERAMVPLP